MKEIEIYNKEIDIYELFENNPFVIEYLKKRNIKTGKEICFKDLLEIIKGEDKKEIIIKYLKIKKYEFKEHIIKKPKVIIFQKVKRESIWKALKKFVYPNLTVRKLICEIILNYKINSIDYENINKKYNKNLNEYIDSINEIVNIGDMKDRILLFHDIFFYDKLSNNLISDVTFEEFLMNLQCISKVNITSLLRKRYSKYLHQKGVNTGNDLMIYLTKERFVSEYTELIYLKPFFGYEFKGDQFIDSFINKQNITNEMFILMMKVKNVKNKDIIDITGKKDKEVNNIYSNILDLFCELFDSYNGIKFIKYLLTFENGYITKDKLKKIMPKYYSLIIYLQENNCIYNLRYIDYLEIYTYRINKLLDIKFDKKILSDAEYSELVKNINNECIERGIFLDLDYIHSKILKVYNKQLIGYIKGYVSNEYKFFSIYVTYFQNGIREEEYNMLTSLYKEIYNEIIDVKYILYIYSDYNRGISYIKKNIYYKFENLILNEYYYNLDEYNYKLDKYNDNFKMSLSEDNQFKNKYNNITRQVEKTEKEKIENRYLVLMICESMKGVFKVEDIASESKLSPNNIRKELNKSLMYYRLSYSKYINSDLLVLKEDLLMIFKIKDLSIEGLYDKVKGKCNDFLNYYKIKDKKILYKIYLKYQKKSKERLKKLL